MKSIRATQSSRLSKAESGSNESEGVIGLIDGDGQEMGAPDPGAGQPSFVRSALIFYGVMGCVALIWRMAAPGQSILYPSASAENDAWGLFSALGAGLLVGLVAVGVSEVLTRATALGEGLADLLGESLAGLRAADAVLLALASGLAEEMLFRGALQPAVGIVWASLIFGACHFLPRRELALWSGYAVLMGFAFGTLFEWTGNLMAPVAAHALVNGINLPRLARRYEESQATAETSTTPNHNDDDLC
jgi:CAAX protease family protein